MMRGALLTSFAVQNCRDMNENRSGDLLTRPVVVISDCWLQNGSKANKLWPDESRRDE
jgi:hypothetical protein